MSVVPEHVAATGGAGAGQLSGIEAVLAAGAVHSVFQPIVDLVSGVVVAFEALARGPVGPLESPMALFGAARDVGCWTSWTRRVGPRRSGARASWVWLRLWRCS